MGDSQPCKPSAVCSQLSRKQGRAADPDPEEGRLGWRGKGAKTVSGHLPAAPVTEADSQRIERLQEVIKRTKNGANVPSR